VGFGIEYQEPGGDKFFAIKNRLSFADAKGKIAADSTSSLLAPIQKFRWVHFPRNANMDGDFTYKVKPVFMNAHGELSYGESQVVAIQLRRDTYPGKLNVAFTRGFVSSQAFVDKYNKDGGVSGLLPSKSDQGLKFKPTHPEAGEALAWMGFEAREAILDLLDDAIKDKSAKVTVVAFDLNLPDVVDRLEKLGKRLRVIIDDSGEHKPNTSAESQAEVRLRKSTGGQVKRQHMSQLQHNKTIVVDGKTVKAAVCGSTNFTWRGFYVQANNAIIVYGAKAIQPFTAAFESYWQNDSVKTFGPTPPATWKDLGIAGVEAKVAFSPHSPDNALLDEVAKDIDGTQSSLFYSLAFLYQTTGSIRDVITKKFKNNKLFVYGISDKKTKGGGIDVQTPGGNISPVYPAEIGKSFPEPFKSEPSGGMGTRMHHKFVVIDFDKPTARVYMGSYNFSPTADTKNGENLLLIKDRRIAVSYMIEALRLVDHYHFRVALKESKQQQKVLSLARPPKGKNEAPWWKVYYTDALRIKDRELFA
jgi:hypothetical protein